jgi:transcriptional regulator with XRE-family HTH domain
MTPETAMLIRMPRQKESPSVFGTRMIAARKARGITQTQLAHAIGSTQRAISYYEAEGGNPPMEVAAKIAKALGTTADDLLGLLDTAENHAPETTDERRLWRRFRQLLSLPEKDRRAVLRMLDSLTKVQQSHSKSA